MALQASGAIALSDVNVELGYSSTATIALNDAAVRALFDIATGAISMSDGYSKSSSLGNVENFFSAYTYDGNIRYSSSDGTVRSEKTDVPLANTAAWSCTTMADGVYSSGGYTNLSVDSSGNQYLVITDAVTGALITTKTNSSSVVQWTRSIALPNSNIVWYPTQIAADSSGNVFVAVYKYNQGNNTSSGVLLKYNSSGTLQWQREQIRGTGSTNVNIWYDMTVNSAGDVIAVGQSNQSGTTYGIVSKYSTSGTIQWTLRLTGSGGTPNCYAQKCAADSSGNVYVIFYNNTSSGDSGHLIKVDSSGSVTWQRKLSSTGNGVRFVGVCTDSSSNVFVTGTAYGTADSITGDHGMVVKWNSSGTLQWSRFYNVLGYSSQWGGTWSGTPTCDSSGNVYVCGSKYNPSSAYDWMVGKYTSSGEYSTAQGGWQCQISNYYTSDFANRCLINPATGKLLVYGRTTIKDFSTNMAWVTMPTDGSAQSGYAGIFMQRVSPTFQNRTLSLTEAAGSLATEFGSAENGYFTDSAGSFTDSSGTLQPLVTRTQEATTSTGGLVWIKRRTADGAHQLLDTTNVSNFLSTSWRTNNSSAATADTTYRFDHTASGFSLGYDGSTGGQINAGTGTGSDLYVAWTFRRSKKFFDIVRYTGTGSATTISHNLGSTPGFIFVKRLDSSGSAYIYHRSLGATIGTMSLHSMGGADVYAGMWNNTEPTSSVFTVGDYSEINASGGSFAAYLFAHNAGGFGPTGTDNIVSCGSFSTPASGGLYEVTLGYEPQYLLLKNTVTNQSWYVADTMRGMWRTNVWQMLAPNALQMEYAENYLYPNSTGFTYYSGGTISGAANYIYLAIRRPPLKIPTVGTEVYKCIARTGTGGRTAIKNVGFAPDLLISHRYNGGGSGDAIGTFWDRLRGAGSQGQYLHSQRNYSEYGSTNGVLSFDHDGLTVGTDGGYTVNTGGFDYRYFLFRRAPKVFDIVPYFGTGSTRTVTHNLQAVPQLILIKQTNDSTNWAVQPLGDSSKFLQLNGAQDYNSFSAPFIAEEWGSTNPTSSVFTLGADSNNIVNRSGGRYVAYLFGTLAGVSKVGTFTGNASLQTINCGFSTPARFILIKRTDNSGDWYVFDSTNPYPIGSGNDGYFRLNDTSGGNDVINTNYVDQDSTGFKVTSDASATINISGANYIFLAFS